MYIKGYFLIVVYSNASNDMYTHCGYSFGLAFAYKHYKDANKCEY